MSATSRSSDEISSDLTALAREVAEGGGLPAMVRAAGRVLGVGIAVVDRSSAVLAVAAASSEEKDRLRSRGAGIGRRRLKVAGQAVGELRMLRREGRQFDQGLADLVAALLALELVQTRSGEWADEDRMSGFVEAVLARELTGPDEIADRAADLGLSLADGAGVVIARLVAHPGADESTGGTQPDTDLGRRALVAALRTLGSGGGGVLAALGEANGASEVRAVVPAADDDRLARAARALEAELTGTIGEETAALIIGYSSRVEQPGELFRAGKEALLALNVAEAEGTDVLAFEATGSYRLLLSAMSENPAELEWFYEDTVGPLAAYDRQYGTNLVTTVETFLKNDGNVGPTAEELFTHRHTVRYRLTRVRDLCGHDIQTTDGRERLGFGLKAMRALGLGTRDG